MGTYINCDHTDPCACFERPIDLYGLTLHPDIIRCMSPQSEIMVKPNDCGACDTWLINWCQAFNNNVFGSSDGSIKVGSVQTYYKNPDGSVATDKSGNPIGRCTLDFIDNQTFYINGKRVFCKGKTDPSERHMCLETVGLTHYWKEHCGECGDAACETLVLDASEFALARAIDVGCTGSSLNSLTPVKNVNGTIKLLVDCNIFTIETDKSSAGLTDDDIIRLGMVKTPIFEINGVAPTSQGEFTVEGEQPIVVENIANGVKVKLNYNQEDFVLNGQSALSLRQTEFKVFGALGSPVSIDTRLEAAGTPISTDPNWVVGGTTMTIWEKSVTIGSVTIPFVAPGNWEWLLDINIQVDSYPLFPSNGTEASAIPASGVVQAKAYVNNSLVSDISGQQRECSPFSFSAALIARGDNVIKGVFNVPQTAGANVPINVLYQYSRPAATKDTMCRVESSEMSFSGFLRLVKIS